MEQWKTIKEYEGHYEVSDLGLVRNARTGKILNLHSNNSGYLVIDLHKDGTHKTFSVHRLVAKAFIPNPDNLPEVNHLNEDKHDNRATNLEWCDRVHNINHGTRIERQSKPVLCVETGEIFQSTKAAGRYLSKSSGGISECCNGNRNTAFGFHWQYVN